MPIFHHQTRGELRQMYVDAWRKRRARLPAEPLELQIADVVEDHPEYHTVLETPEAAVGHDYAPEYGETNPFLHMGLHLAVRDQVTTDRPAGIRAAFGTLAANTGSAHAAEHIMIEFLAEALWSAQRSGLPPDEQAYLERIKARAAP